MPDGKHSVDCYMACLDMCYNKLSTKVAANGGSGNLVEDNDFFVNHCTSTYLCKRAFKRVCEKAYPSTPPLPVLKPFPCLDLRRTFCVHLTPYHLFILFMHA